MQLLPTSKPGRIAAQLFAACAAIFAFAIVVSLVVEDEVDNSSLDVLRFVVGTSFLLTAIGAIIAGSVAVIRERERALVVLAAVPLSLLAVVFVLGDAVTR